MRNVNLLLIISLSSLLLAQCCHFVQQFKYLGHIIENTLCDDCDIKRELRCLFTRTNILVIKFSRCSTAVKLQLFKSYYICFYDVALWHNFHIGVLDKLAFAYVRRVKIFFDFHKYRPSSITAMFLQLGLPTFNIVLLNARARFATQLNALCQDNPLLCICRPMEWKMVIGLFNHALCCFMFV